MDAKKESSGVRICGSVLEPEDFPDDNEDRVEGGEIFRPGDDIRYFAERIRKGNYSIKGNKGRKF